MKAKNHYEVLGLKPTKSVGGLNYYDYNKVQIEKAAKKARVKWHPDQNKSAEATARFQEIGDALNILSNPHTKKDYDEQLRRPQGAPDKRNIMQQRQFEYNKFGPHYRFLYECSDEMQNTFPFEATIDKLFVEAIQLGYIEYKFSLLKTSPKDCKPKDISDKFFIKICLEESQKEFIKEVCNVMIAGITFDINQVLNKFFKSEYFSQKIHFALITLSLSSDIHVSPHCELISKDLAKDFIFNGFFKQLNTAILKHEITRHYSDIVDHMDIKDFCDSVKKRKEFHDKIFSILHIFTDAKIDLDIKAYLDTFAFGTDLMKLSLENALAGTGSADTAIKIIGHYGGQPILNGIISGLKFSSQNQHLYSTLKSYMCFKGSQFDMEGLLTSQQKELFPLVQEGIYTEKEILELQQEKRENDVNEYSLFKRIIVEALFEQVDWPTKIAKLKWIKESLTTVLKFSSQNKQLYSPLKSYMCFKGSQFDMQGLLTSQQKELFPLVQEGIYTEKEILELNQKYGKDVYQQPLFQGIMVGALSEQAEWPEKVAKLKRIKEKLIKSPYFEWIKTSLLDQLEAGVFDESLNQEIIALRRDVEKVIVAYIKHPKQLNLKSLHNNIKSTLVAFSQKPSVTQYEYFSDYICAVIGFFLAVPFALLPLLSDDYCATFFRSDNRNRADALICKFDDITEPAVSCISA